MRSNRLWGIGTAIVIVAVLALGWVLGVSPKLNELAGVTASLDAVNAQNQQHQLELAALEAQFENIDELRDELADLQAAVPSDVGLPDFIRQLNTLAAATGVAIDSISTSDPGAYSVPAVPGTTVDAEGNVVALPAAPANLVTINTVIKIKGTPSAILLFVKGLQSGDRLFFISELAIGEPTAPAATEGEDEAAAVEISTTEITGLTFVLEVPEAPAS